jgi:CBS domain containing-hemolysin-like protein
VTLSLEIVAVGVLILANAIFVAALLLVVTNRFFVATEFSVARIRVTQLAELEAEGRPGARPLCHAIHHLDSLSSGFAFDVATLPHVVLGELAPKSLAIATRVRGVLVEALRFEAGVAATEPA